MTPLLSASSTNPLQSLSPSPSLNGSHLISPLCQTTTLPGFHPDNPTASSTNPLYPTGPFPAPSSPHDAVSTTTGRAASIRCASAVAANPPNTTACTAPSRFAARMPTSAAGIMGMYTSTTSPFFTPCSRSTPANVSTWRRSSA